jgi:hypothetical protein
LEKNLSLVGFTDLGRLLCDPACTSDVWAHRNFAYVGTFNDSSGTRVGVQVVDISDPSNPQVVNMLPTPLPSTAAHDVKVAAFLPPAGTGPGLLWGVYVHKDLVLGSDLLSGLFILKQKPEK